MLNNVRITSAMDVTIHGALSLLFGLLSSGVIAGGQAVLQTGTNTPVIATAGVIGFLAPFLHGFIALVQSPQAAQAASDVKAEALSALDNRLSALEAHHQQVTQIVQTLWNAAQVPQPAAVVSQPVAPAPAAPEQPYPGTQIPDWMKQVSLPVPVPPKG